MKTSRFLLSSAPLAFVVLFSAGCQAPLPPEGPTLATVTAETPHEYERLFTAAEDALMDHYLWPDRRDRSEGVITTHRDTTAHWFELWRPQPQPAYFWAESNLQTVQRQALVHIRPTDQPGRYEVDVQVDRYRLHLEERQVDNAAGALRLFSSDAPTYGGNPEYTPIGRTKPGQTPKLAETSYWSHVGRDEYMERAILAAIIRRYGLATASDTPPESLSTAPH